MRISTVRHFILFTVVALSCAVPLMAQGDTCRKQRIALYDRHAFSRTDGVVRLKRAEDVAVDGGFRSERPDEATSRREYQRRKTLIVDPMLAEINDSIRRFSEENRIRTVEVSELIDSGAIIGMNGDFDITAQLVKFLNGDSVQIPPISLEESRVVTIDSRKFRDADKGLNGFRSRTSKELMKLCESTSLCTDLLYQMESYARREGISLILDPSKNIPESIVSLACEDITEHFISDYNRNTSKN